MNPYDTAATRAVWNRVLQPQEDRPAAGMSLEERLKEMIADEHADHHIYLALARHAGPHAAALRTLAMQEDGHGRTLSALYYLLTGECYTPETAACCPGNFCRALRERFNEELEGAKQYREAAECWPEHRSMFLKLAQDESRHSRVLHGIACRMMRR